MEGLTVVLGASENPQRYSNMAVRRLVALGLPVLAIGKRAGLIASTPIRTDIPPGTWAHTVTIYLAPANQSDWRARVLALKPSRVIFNPGAEHAAFATELREAGIEVVEACTLVMLATGGY